MKGKKEGRGEKEERGKGEGEKRKGEREREKTTTEFHSRARTRDLPLCSQPPMATPLLRLQGRFARTYYTCIYRKFRF